MVPDSSGQGQWRPLGAGLGRVHAERADQLAVELVGATEGSIAESIPNLWATNLFYALLYTAAETSQQGLPRHVAADLAVAAFLWSIAA